MGIRLPFFAWYLFFLILTDLGLQRSGTLLHWFVVVVLPILQDSYVGPLACYFKILVPRGCQFTREYRAALTSLCNAPLPSVIMKGCYFCLSQLCLWPEYKVIDKTHFFHVFQWHAGKLANLVLV